MLTHLIILLDDTSPSYCHYDVTLKERRLIGLDDLKSGILFAMKENLNIQFVYPSYELPEEYVEAIESIDHTKIKPDSQSDEADVLILSDWKEVITDIAYNSTCIIRASRTELLDNRKQLKALMSKISRLNIAITDVDIFSDNDIDSILNDVREDSNMKALIDNMLKLEDGTNILAIVAECQNEFNIKYPSMINKKKEWYHIIDKYVKEVTHRENIQPDEIIHCYIADVRNNKLKEDCDRVGEEGSRVS